MALKLHQKSIRYLFFAMVVWSTTPLHAQEKSTHTDSLSVTFLFHLADSRFNLDFADNIRQYQLLQNFVTSLNHQTDYVVYLTTSASPDGPEMFNRELCYHRAVSTQIYLQAVLPIFFNGNTQWRTEYRYEDWQGLEQALRTCNVTGRDEALKLLSGGVTNYKSSVKEELKALHDGRTWAELEDSIMPSLRYARVHICKKSPDTLSPELLAAVVSALEKKGIGIGTAQGSAPLQADTIHVDTLIPLTAQGAPQTVAAQTGALQTGTFPKVKKQKSGQYQFALKTNLLYDVATAVNFELEFPIRNHCSILAEAVFPWWIINIKDQYYALEVMHASLEFRCWLGNRKKRPVLQGWFIGAYAASTLYDLEWQNRGVQGENYIHGGLTAGYSFKIGTNWRIETSIGVGYMPNKYREYQHRTDLGLLVWQRDGAYTWIGPTKLKCSISWLIPSKKKGGSNEK